MADPRGRIGDPGLDRALRLGLRASGVTVPEIMEAFGVPKDSARRYVLRLVREGKLVRTQERRRRPDIYCKATGAGAFVYRAATWTKKLVYRKGG